MTGRRSIDRRRFLAQSAGALGTALFGRLPLEAMAQEARSPVADAWDSGLVRHILPTVSDSRVLLKVSVDRPLAATPTLQVGTVRVQGRMSDTVGEYWQFHAADLEPGRSHTLTLQAANGASLCEPWSLSTFPASSSAPERFRALFFTCAGGPGGTYEGIGRRQGFLPTAIRTRLLRRALSFAPDAAIANGDHIYWDLHIWQGENAGELSEFGRQSHFDFSAITTVLSGPIGTGPSGFPSVIRGIGASSPQHLDMEETAAPIEDHGFTLVDFLPDRMVLRQFRWDVDREPLEAIDRLEPFFTTELERPA